LALAQEYHPDLIFTDIKMPDLGGEELTQLLRADPELHNVPVVILSGTAFLVDLEATQANAILNKPFELRTVYALLEHFLPIAEPQINKADQSESAKEFQPPMADQVEFV
jgi:CheY-like chemotaxis protein